MVKRFLCELLAREIGRPLTALSTQRNWGKNAAIWGGGGGGGGRDTDTWLAKKFHLTYKDLYTVRLASSTVVRFDLTR